MTHPSGDMAGTYPLPQAGDGAEKVFAWMNAVLMRPGFITGAEDLRGEDQNIYNPLDIDAILHLGGDTTRRITLRGNSIFSQGRRIWIDQNYTVIHAWDTDRGKLLDHTDHLKAELAKWGYDFTDDYDTFSESLTKTVLIRAQDGYLTLTRKAPHIMGGKTIDICRINNIGVPGTGDQVYAKWSARDRLIPDTEEARHAKIQATIQNVLIQTFAARGYEPWDFTEKSINADGGYRLAYRKRTPDLEWDEATTWVTPANGSDPYDYMVEGDLIRAIEAEIRLDALLAEKGAITMTSLTRSLLENGGIINRNGKGTVTIRRRMLTFKGSNAFYTIRQRKGRLEADVQIRGKVDVHLSTGTYLVTNTTLPDTAIAGISGTPLRQMIDHPLIPEDILITSARNTKDGVAGEIRGPSYPWKHGAARMKPLNSVQEDDSKA